MNSGQVIKRGIMKILVFVFICLSSFVTFGMTPEETKEYSAQKIKEAVEHSQRMQLEKERIVQEAKRRSKTVEISGPNYPDQEIYEQDR